MLPIGLYVFLSTARVTQNFVPTSQVFFGKIRHVLISASRAFLLIYHASRFLLLICIFLPWGSQCSGIYGGDVFGTQEADASAVCAFCPQPLTLLPCVQMLARGGTGAVDPTEGGGAGGEHSRVRPAAQLPAQVSTGAHEHPPPLPSLIIPSMQTIKGKLHSHNLKQTV